MKRQHYRPFDPEQAKAGAPYGCADDDYEAVVDWYGPNYVTGRCKSSSAVTWCARRWCELTNDDTEVMLVMLPIATCQGKPVFVGDSLYDENGDRFEVEMSYHPDLLARCTWEPARAQVETRMTELELDQAWDKIGDSLVPIANAAIQRAIEDGDVVPTHTIKAIYVFSISLGEEGKFLAENILQAVGPAKSVIFGKGMK